MLYITLIFASTSALLQVNRRVQCFKFFLISNSLLVPVYYYRSTVGYSILSFSSFLILCQYQCIIIGQQQGSVLIFSSILMSFWVLVLTMINKGAYLIYTCISIFHQAPNLIQFYCEITLESVTGTNHEQYNIGFVSITNMKLQI